MRQTLLRSCRCAQKLFSGSARFEGTVSDSHVEVSIVELLGVR